MFLRNWDNYKTYEVMMTHIGLSINPNKETSLKDYQGWYQAPPWQNNDYNYINWTTSGYETAPGSGESHFMIWPGGKVGDAYTRPQPGIDKGVVRYEDYNLFSPFYGGTGVETGFHIYGQQHIGSGWKYIEEEDMWENTVTREFKNISGQEITVEEVGVFGWVRSLIAKEILEEPIVVQNDSYFKLSFTYRVENPHENKKDERIREIRFGGVTVKDDMPTQISPSKTKNVMVITQCQYNNSNFEALKNFAKLQLSGWERIQDTISIFTNNRIIQVDYLRPLLETEENIIKTSSYSYNKYTYVTFYYCTDNLKSFSLSSYDFIPQAQLKESTVFSITPNLDRENRMFLMLPEYPFNNVWISQLDDDRCDLFYDHAQLMSLYLDRTNALSHTFQSNFYDYNLWYLIFNPEMEKDTDGNEIPLYHDIFINK